MTFPLTLNTFAYLWFSLRSIDSERLGDRESTVPFTHLLIRVWFSSVYDVVKKYCLYFPKSSCQFSFPHVINHIDVNAFWSYSVKKVIHFSRTISEAHHCPVDFHQIPFFTWKMSTFLNCNSKYWIRLLISISLIIQGMSLQSVEHFLCCYQGVKWECKTFSA